MKLYCDKNSSSPTYFIQQGFRNDKKTTTKNIYRIGKHNDPLVFAKSEVERFNKEFSEQKVPNMNVEISFNE